VSSVLLVSNTWPDQAYESHYDYKYRNGV